MAKQTVQISVRITPALASFLEEWGKSQVPEDKPRAVARFAIEVFRAMAKQLDAGDWHAVARQAADEGKDIGTFLGALLKAKVGNEPKIKK